MSQFALWSDDPSETDLLSFDAVAETIVDALLDDTLDPIALGVSGPWGSGKTTVLRLCERLLAEKNTEEETVLVVTTDPWRYDPATGAKESLISEVLGSLQSHLASFETTSDKTKRLLKRLVTRVDWSRAVRIATNAVTLQVPSIDDVLGLVKPPSDADDQVRGLDEFRAEFAQLMASEDMASVRRVIVLVDDLDRCLPETVVETLEAIRLFLAVPKMSFVLAADEERVAEAIRTRFPAAEASVVPASQRQGEEPAKLYLHKIVQTTVPLPALSRFDTQAYLLLLQLQARLEPTDFSVFVGQCTDIRLKSGDVDDLIGVKGVDIAEELAFSARLTPLLYEKLRGNPRRVKRFLNDLNVRQAIAARRGISLDPSVVAKLMVLEVLLPDEFSKLLEWLAQGLLRDQMTALEVAAGKPAPSSPPEEQSPPADESSGDKKERKTAKSDSGGETEFSDVFIRWAKLPPSLSTVDIAPYLHLAAAFAGKEVLATGLPERLRDIAANLLSTVRAEQLSVGDDDLSALSAPDAEAIVVHLGRMARDRPTEQRKAVSAIVRISRIHSEVAEFAVRALGSIPADEVALGTPLLFSMPADDSLRPALEHWRDETSKTTVKKAVAEALKEKTNGH